MDEVSKYKIVLTGSADVGKTSLLTRITKNYFSKTYNPTVGIGFGFWETVVEGHTVRLQIWDTAGTERYQSITPIYYQNAEAALICYSLKQTEKESEEAVKFWVKKFLDTVQSKPIFIVGNKRDKNDTISDEMERYLKEQGKYKLYKVSAKTGEGVIDLFSSVAKEVWKNSFPKSEFLEQNTRVSGPPQKTSCSC
ncbi:small GTP-binding protein [Histomonas meleagridis]|uniref:small GTP-binding protein n=1 Tax=Histomonas meleagridis TaxID=135588 RepID=UPI00355A1FBF|nr:small GTP-binding protein [Histomonas meleagridis]KAH0803990.1 small GTP-binding protein [Histomonas meleagridis]